MKVIFNNFSRLQLKLLHDNIEEALLNEFDSYCLTIHVDEPLENPEYTAKDVSGCSITHLDIG